MTGSDEKQQTADEAAPLLPTSTSEDSLERLARMQRTRRLFLVGLFVTTMLWLCFAKLTLLYRIKEHKEGHGVHGHVHEVPASPSTDHTAPKVALEAHIMSKCPDAQECLQDLVVPTMERVSDRVNFTLSYIGTPVDSDDGVECKHGGEECLGNIIQLCAAHLYKDPKTYLGFSMCMINDYEDIPNRNLVEDCALEHGVDFEKLNNCVSEDDGSYGLGLLRKSVKRSISAGVGISCTVRLNDKVRCIRDGGEWKDCDSGASVGDLVRDIDALYK